MFNVVVPMIKKNGWLTPKYLLLNCFGNSTTTSITIKNVNRNMYTWRVLAWQRNGSNLKVEIEMHTFTKFWIKNEVQTIIFAYSFLKVYHFNYRMDLSIIFPQLLGSHCKSCYSICYNLLTSDNG